MRPWDADSWSPKSDRSDVCRRLNTDGIYKHHALHRRVSLHAEEAHAPMQGVMRLVGRAAVVQTGTPSAAVRACQREHRAATSSMSEATASVLSKPSRSMPRPRMSAMRARSESQKPPML